MQVELVAVGQYNEYLYGRDDGEYDPRKRYIITFQITGLDAKPDDVADCVDNLGSDIFLHEFISRDNLYQVGLVTSKEDWRQARKILVKRLETVKPQTLELGEVINDPRDMLTPDLLEIQIGQMLVPLCPDIMDKLTNLRLRIARDFGVILPAVRIRDDASLTDGEYRILIRDEIKILSEVQLDHFLLIDEVDRVPPIGAIETVDPVFGVKSYWITEEMKPAAELAGWANIVEPAAVVLTHFQEVVRPNLCKLLTQQAVHDRLEQLQKTAPALVNDVIPGQIRIPGLHYILTQLLRTGWSIRDLEGILETIARYHPENDVTVILKGFLKEPDETRHDGQELLGDGPGDHHGGQVN